MRAYIHISKHRILNKIDLKGNTMTTMTLDQCPSCVKQYIQRLLQADRFVEAKLFWEHWKRVGVPLDQLNLDSDPDKNFLRFLMTSYQPGSAGGYLAVFDMGIGKGSDAVKPEA